MKTSLFLIPSVALSFGVAQAQTELPPIMPDSPDFTVSTSIVPRGKFQTETRALSLRRGDQHEYRLGGSLIRYGISQRAEIRVQTPNYNRIRQGITITGLEDAAIEFKARVYENEKAEFGVLLDTTIPTGSNFISEETYQPAITLAGQFKINEKLNFNANLSARRASTNLQKYSRLGAAAELKYEAEKLIAYAEVYGFNRLQDDGDSQKFAALGAIYRFNARTALDARIGTGISNDVGGSDRFYGFGFSRLY